MYVYKEFTTLSKVSLLPRKMKSSIMGLAFKALVCVLLLLVHESRSASIPRFSSNNEVAALVGGNALLPCHLPTFAKIPEAVLWKKIREAEETMVYFKSANDQLMNQTKTYMGRTTMLGSWLNHGEVTLTVKNITKNDAGEYSCWIKESSLGPLSERKCCSIKLYVEEKEKDKQQQLIMAWTLYLLFLMLCVCVSYRCGSQQKRNSNDT